MALRDDYYTSAGTRATVSLEGSSSGGAILLFGAPGLGAAAAQSLCSATEGGLVAIFNKLTNAKKGKEDTALWAQVGRLSLVSPTLLLRKIIATVAQQSGTETAQTLATLVLRLGRTFCHYTVGSGTDSPTLFTSCVSLQLKASAQEPREVSNLIAFVSRLGEVVSMGNLVRGFVLPHLAVDSVHLPGSLQLVQLALSVVSETANPLLPMMSNSFLTDCL